MESNASKISHLSPGTKLNNGRYTVKRLIGAGGFGCTYEVASGDRRYCIKEFFMSQNCKRLPDGSIQIVTDDVDLVEHSMKKFMEEAKVLYLMKHPGIVSVVDIFEENGTAYFVMDYIEGQPMHNYIKEHGPLPEEAAIGYILQVANALDYVHKNNRLHLDIKPENIMIDPWGRAILIDFGASKFFDHDGTKSTNVYQTPGYAPIEQVHGIIEHFGPYTDIYALGATLYYMLSGMVPVNSLLRNDGVELTPLPAHISQPTIATIFKAMSILRKNRQQTIEEFVNMLPQIQSYGEDVQVEVAVVDAEAPEPSSTDNYVCINPDKIQIIPEEYQTPVGFPAHEHRQQPNKDSWSVGQWILMISAIAVGAVLVFLLLMAIAE